MALKRPQKADTDAVARDRARGALLGLAVGSALGMPMRKKRTHAPMFPQLAQGVGTEMLGGGVFSVKPGQVGDDVLQACCIADSLLKLGRYDMRDVTRRFIEWAGSAIEPTGGCVPMIRAIEDMGLPAGYGLGRTMWHKSRHRLWGSGSIARTAPIGVYFAKDDEARARASLEDSGITHYDPHCQLGCAAVNGSIAHAITSTKKVDPDKLVEAASLGLSLGSALLGRSAPDIARDIPPVLVTLRADLELARKPDPELYGPQINMVSDLHMYSARVAFRLAYWELFHAPSFEAALVDVVNRSGDTDSNGAVTGCLLGAYYGEQAIPERWRTAVLGALSGMGPLWTRYHPRFLLALTGT